MNAYMVRPRAELQCAVLNIERVVLDVDRTVGLVDHRRVLINSIA